MMARLSRSLSFSSQKYSVLTPKPVPAKPPDLAPHCATLETCKRLNEPCSLQTTNRIWGDGRLRMRPLTGFCNPNPTTAEKKLVNDTVEALNQQALESRSS